MKTFDPATPMVADSPSNGTDDDYAFLDQILATPSLADTARSIIADAKHSAGDGELTDETVAKIIQLTGARRLDTISTARPEPLLLDRLDPTGHTILYGPGGIGKGALACHWIGQLVTSGHRILILDYENHPEEWARRITSLGYGSLRDRILWEGPNSADSNMPPGAIWEHAETLRDLARAFNATYVVVDSAIQASMGVDPNDQEAPTKYASALQKIGLPPLSLGHVRKDGDAKMPFGSVGWHNNARLTWSMERKGDDVILKCRKHNNYAAQPQYLVQATWLLGDLAEVAERPYQAVLSDRIDDVLTEPMTVEQIAKALNDQIEDEDASDIKTESIRRTLNRGAKTIEGHNPTFTKTGNKWTRWEPAESPRTIALPGQLALVEDVS